MMARGRSRPLGDGVAAARTALLARRPRRCSGSAGGRAARPARCPSSVRRMTAATIGNGLTLEYDEHGDGEPLLLIMGLGAQLLGWPIGFVELLAEQGFRVIRFDNRDIGLSSQIDAPAPTRRQVVLSADRSRASPSRPTRSTTWPTTPPACSTSSASTGRTSSAPRWAG